MLKLADARETRSNSEFLMAIDGELDAVIMKLEELRKSGGLSGYSVKRGMNLINDLRGKLESARKPHDVNAAFLETDALRDLVDEALQTLGERG